MLANPFFQVLLLFIVKSESGLSASGALLYSKLASEVLISSQQQFQFRTDVFWSTPTGKWKVPRRTSRMGGQRRWYYKLKARKRHECSSFLRGIFKSPQVLEGAWARSSEYQLNKSPRRSGELESLGKAGPNPSGLPATQTRLHGVGGKHPGHMTRQPS